MFVDLQATNCRVIAASSANAIAANSRDKVME